MCVNTLTAGWMNLSLNYLLPQLAAGAPGLLAAFAAAPAPARMQCVITLVVMVLLVVVIVDSLLRWSGLRERPRAAGRAPAAVPEPGAAL